MIATRRVLQRFLNKHDLEGSATPHQGGDDLPTPSHDMMTGHRCSSTYNHNDLISGSMHAGRSLSSGRLPHESSRPSLYLSLNSSREVSSHRSLTSDHEVLGKAREDPTPAVSTPGYGDTTVSAVSAVSTGARTRAAASGAGVGCTPSERRRGGFSEAGERSAEESAHSKWTETSHTGLLHL